MSDTHLAPAATADRGRLLRAVADRDWAERRMGEFAAFVTDRHGRHFASYQDLWTWSVDAPDDFWRAVIDFFELGITDVPERLIEGEMPSARWLSGARLNYAREALKHTGTEPAVLGLSQTRSEVVLGRDDLRDQVAACRAGLVRLGVRRGDSVAAYLPNVPEAVVLLLATASLGAVFASCPPEFGIRAVVDRFSQVDPVVLVVTDGYRYGDRTIDRSEVSAELAAALPGLRAVVTHQYIGETVELTHDAPAPTTWDELVGTPGELTFEDVPFDHPLYVLFSSGSTGRPKAIVHGHGGILLEHAKALGLHNDVRAGDRFFWFATTGWMVWNYAVSALVHGAAVVCYDGNPAFPDGLELWRAASRVGATFFGTSAAHVAMSASRSLDPSAACDFSTLRAIGSTGSALPAEGFEWLDAHVSTTAHLSSVSGGTDVCSGFVGGSPLAPTRAGELSAPMLGCRAVALDEDGNAVVGRFGELCITAPMPSMPLGFLHDPDQERYRAAYFDRFAGVWAHGDWVQFFDDGACVIAGRSDTTLNRGGVRLGTSDIYGVVDHAPEVDDSLVVHLEDEKGGAGTLLLLLAAPGVEDADREALERHLVGQIRTQLSPRHVPDVVVWTAGLPRTLTGKKLEKPVKQLLLGASAEAVASADSLTNPAQFAALVAWAADFRRAT